MIDVFSETAEPRAPEDGCWLFVLVVIVVVVQVYSILRGRKVVNGGSFIVVVEVVNALWSVRSRVQRTYDT